MTLQEYKSAKYPFEEYLKEIHADNYMGTDDDMPDNFDDFLGNLEGEDYIEHGNAFTKLLLDLISTTAEQEMRENIRKEITVIFSGEEKDLQDLLNAPSLKVDK